MQIFIIKYEQAFVKRKESCWARCQDTARPVICVFVGHTLSIWRKWQKTHCIHSLLVWAEWLKCGRLLRRGAIGVRCLFVCLVLWSACGSPDDSHSALVLKRKLFKDVVADLKKSIECSILGKFQMVSEGEPVCRTGDVAGGLRFRIVTRVEHWGQWTLELSLWGVSKLLGQAGIIEDVHSGRLRDSSSGKALPTKAWSGSREPNGGKQSPQGLVSVLPLPG